MHAVVPLLPGGLLSILGLAFIAGTLAVLAFTDWPKAYTLGAASIVVFGLQFVQEGFLGAPLGLGELALIPDRLLAGDWWTPLTYAFLHGGLLHIFGNLFILLTAGPALEDSVGPWWFLGIYAAGALAAAAAGVGLSFVDPAQASVNLPSPGTPMVGASGAIFAVLTAFAVRHPREKLPIPFWIVIWLPSMLVLGIFLAMNVGYLFLDTSVAWYGHFAGFIAGLVAATLPIDALSVGPGGDGVDVDRLEAVATTPRAREALDRLRELDPDEDDVAGAWLDELAEAGECPACGRGLERDGLDVACPEGHALEAAGDDEPPTGGRPAGER